MFGTQNRRTTTCMIMIGLLIAGSIGCGSDKRDKRLRMGRKAPEQGTSNKPGQNGSNKPDDESNLNVDPNDTFTKAERLGSELASGDRQTLSSLPAGTYTLVKYTNVIKVLETKEAFAIQQDFTAQVDANGQLGLIPTESTPRIGTLGDTDAGRAVEVATRFKVSATEPKIYREDSSTHEASIDNTATDTKIDSTVGPKNASIKASVLGILTSGEGVTTSTDGLTWTVKDDTKPITLSIIKAEENLYRIHVSETETPVTREYYMDYQVEPEPTAVPEADDSI